MDIKNDETLHHVHSPSIAFRLRECEMSDSRCTTRREMCHQSVYKIEIFTSKHLKGLHLKMPCWAGEVLWAIVMAIMVNSDAN